MSDPLLVIDKVVKRYGSITAVDGVSLDIRENEFFALLGPSGCGKTTLLRMLAGFETLSAGRILLQGQDIAPLPPNRRPLNLMFQSYALFPHMSVRQNIAYGLEMEKRPRAEIARRVDEMLATTHLLPFATRRPDQLSGGQRQRVALARALVKRPRVLLLDEPLGALDKKLRGQMQLELKRLQHEVGITFIVVTHDQDEALVMADRMAILRNGRILQCDTPEAVYERPVDRFVADFIGTMNFIDAHVTPEGVEAAGLTLAVETPADARPGDAVCLAVRPEHIGLAVAGEPGVPGRVVESAYHGLDRQLFITTDLAATPLQVRLQASEANGLACAAGDAVTVRIPAARCRVLTD